MAPGGQLCGCLEHPAVSSGQPFNAAYMTGRFMPFPSR